jgi:hypothetical protein
MGGQGVDRRRFLQGIGVLGAATLVGGALPSEAALASTAAKKQRTVYRLSTHGTHACNACKGHGANRYYRLSVFADEDRAHGGCNCPIVTQSIGNGLYQRWFRLPHGGLAPVFDLRSRAG